MISRANLAAGTHVRNRLAIACHFNPRDHGTISLDRTDSPAPILGPTDTCAHGAHSLVHSHGCSEWAVRLIHAVRIAMDRCLGFLGKPRLKFIGAVQLVNAIGSLLDWNFLHRFNGRCSGILLCSFGLFLLGVTQIHIKFDRIIKIRIEVIALRVAVVVAVRIANCRQGVLQGHRIGAKSVIFIAIVVSCWLRLIHREVFRQLFNAHSDRLPHAVLAGLDADKTRLEPGR